MNKVCSIADAVGAIKDSDTVGCCGVIGWITPDDVLQGLARRFVETGSPNNLTFFLPCASGDGMHIRGMDHVAIPGLMKRVISGSYTNAVNPTTGKRQEIIRLIKENQIEAYSMPIGATMHWLREVARRSPGYMTEIGLGTYIDPRIEGGKLNEITKEDIVKVINFEGKEYLFYPTTKLDVAIIRATTSDEYGNLSFEDEPIMASTIALALAVKACGGKVIAQVKRLTERSTRKIQDVKLSGVFVDHVVVVPNQMMVTDIQFDDRYLGGQKFDPKDIPRLPMGPDKIIARRAAREIKPGVLTIFGYGASSDTPLILVEEGKFNEDTVYDYLFTTEHGSYGGLVMSGWQFSANLYPEAFLDGVSQFDVIDGGNIPFAALAFAEFDAEGNINVSKFGIFNPGAGGFIDIAQNAKELIFAGTFTTRGLKVDIGNGGLRIVKEGSVRKLVKKCEQITYPLQYGIGKRGQKAKLITERAVFEVEADGLVLVEIAKGIDIEKDILNQMEFPPKRIAEPLKYMDEELFRY
jgi:propionate CoA-transferase